MPATHKHKPGKNIKTAFFLNLSFTLIELVGGLLTNSTAILADAIHDLGDTFALGQAWYFENLTTKKGSPKFSYGYKRFIAGRAHKYNLITCQLSFYFIRSHSASFKPTAFKCPGDDFSCHHRRAY